MKASMFFVFVLVLLIAGLLPLGAQAVDPDVYTVVPGDSAWRISGNIWGDPTLWRRVVEKNPILQQKGRITRNSASGWTYVMMHPGEQLFGLQELGVIAPTPTPLSELGILFPATKTMWEQIPTWLWWFLLALILAIFAWFMFQRELREDPSASGPAFVPGGVDAENASVSIQQMAARRDGRVVADSVIPTVYQQFTVIRQTAGRIWGMMTVSYADGRRTTRSLNGERAYSAQVRFPDGRVETLYMLQACGNDLRFGGISRYLPGPEFRFEPDAVQPTAAPVTPTPTETVAEQPVVTPEPQPTAPTPAPEQVAVDPTPSSQPTIEEDVVRIELRKAVDGNGAMARFSGVNEKEDLTCEISPGRIMIRFRPQPPTK